MVLRWLRSLALALWRRVFGPQEPLPAELARPPGAPLGLPLPATPDRASTDYSRQRIAVHEAGHAVVAWHASSVRTLTIHIGSQGGNVECCHYGSATPGARWLRTVILLGGIAAECDSYGGFRSGHCESDLLRARSIVQSLLADGFMRESAARLHLNFSGMFRSPLSVGELLLLEAAFHEARSIVTERRTALLRLVSILTEKDFVTVRDAEPILGSRFRTEFLGLLGLTTFLGRGQPHVTDELP